jgi:hypothetical protein
LNQAINILSGICQWFFGLDGFAERDKLNPGFRMISRFG